MFDIEIAGYLLNSNISKYTIEYLSNEYIKFDIDEYVKNLNINEGNDEQISLFTEQKETVEIRPYIYSYAINKLYYVLTEKLKKEHTEKLFNEIEMPLVEVLANMQYEGIYIEKEELIQFGNSLKENINKLTEEIYSLAGETFNINSTKQLGEVLFEKLKLPIIKKTKTGYSTDVDVLEKLKELLAKN